jgi:hypothetical protein
MVIALCLIPRTIISVWLSYVGTWFLIEADSYGDLILNSVALAFLIEVDEMLYKAVTSVETRKKFENCQPLEVTYNNSFMQGSSRFSMKLWTCLLLVIVISFVTVAYHESRGKYDRAYALSCLCHGEGVRCITAQILGGYSTLKLAMSAQYPESVIGSASLLQYLVANAYRNWIVWCSCGTIVLIVFASTLRSQRLRCTVEQDEDAEGQEMYQEMHQE